MEKSVSSRGRPARRSAALPVLVIVGALLLGGCGGSGNARALLDQAFSHSIHSATVSLDMQVSVAGVGALSQPINVNLSGPFQSNGGKRIPSFDFNVNFAGGGHTLSGTLISTGDNAYVGYGGRNYEIGAKPIARTNSQLSSSSGGGRPLASYGVDPSKWVTSAQDEGDAQVAGTDTTHVRAGLDVARMLHDLNKTIASAGATVRGKVSHGLSDQQIQQVQQVIKAPTFDVYVAKRDKTIRRVAVALGFQIPQGSRRRFAGASGGTVTFSLDLANIGRPEAIQAPTTAEPIASLLSQLRGGATRGLPPGTP